MWAGTNINIDSINRWCYKKLTISCDKISQYKNRETKVIIDFNCNGKFVKRLIDSFYGLERIELTSKCKRLVLNEGKLYSIKNMELLFCLRSLRHVTIIESCTGIRCSACCSCAMIRFVSFPPSVEFIGS